ncbi:MAG TPA: glycoside hydrolase family 3 N-terminal domain-containing protein, partial [Longimicrobiales bacterium]|nr:glycoside hydrolase family 3 N-terminal domain-containing protein [Longimicrobiales bacterium]
VGRVVGRLQARAGHPLLFGADLERGAGQQFGGCTPLPPAAALGSLDDMEACWRAGALTAREARALGVGWVYAPVADLGHEPRNPIVGTRAFGEDPDPVARAVAAWIRGCQDGGALPCVKHFPGHGRTLADSHREMPVVEADEADLARDLVPFSAAVEAGVPAVMTAHVAYPALDPSGAPATRSRPMIQGLLRKTLGFQGLVVTDALIMEGADAGGRGELAGALQALDAGVDALLYPRDPVALSEGLRKAVAAGRLDAGRVLRSAERIAAAAERVGEPVGEWGRPADRSWAAGIARRSLRWIRPPEGVPSLSGGVLTVVDDDLGGPYPAASRRPLEDRLRVLGIEAEDPGGRTESTSATEPGRRVVAVFCDPRGWKGRAGLSEDSRRAVADRAPDAGLVLLFAHPRLAADVPGRAPVLCAWGGEALMQEAAASEVARVAGPDAVR